MIKGNVSCFSIVLVVRDKIYFDEIIKAWEGNLNFCKASGDSVTKLTKTIPVLVNGG